MNSDGFFHCAHCKRVVELPDRVVVAAELGPTGALVDLECPVCRWHEVSWHSPQVRRPRPAPLPVERERGAEWFKRIYEAVK